MDNNQLLKEENISLTEDEIIVGKKKISLLEVESIYIGEQNPAKDRAYAYIAIGVVLIIFTTRWFMAGGVLAILTGIVSFFDSRRKYTVILKKKENETPVAVSYDLKRIKQIEAILKEKISLWRRAYEVLLDISSIWPSIQFSAFWLSSLAEIDLLSIISPIRTCMVPGYLIKAFRLQNSPALWATGITG